MGFQAIYPPLMATHYFPKYPAVSARLVLPRLRSERLTVRFCVALLCLLGAWQASAEVGRVQLTRTPHGGIQPQAMVDAKGVLHLIYLKGDPKAEDVFYVRQEPGQETFSSPLQVNSRPGSAMAIGTIRGAQLALGKSGRVHVAWNGSGSAENHAGAPMLYARLNEAGTAFEPERDLITYAAGLDGGGSVAADPEGNVYVMWHASKPGGPEGEAGRAVFVSPSSDDGKTFARERPATSQPTGACGCCGMRAFADRQGTVYALYRGAGEKVNRDEILLVSRNHGRDFTIANTHAWKIPTCPMSSASLSETTTGTLAAWETDGKVYFARVDARTKKVSPPVSPVSPVKNKHPVAVGNAQGQILLAWTEGTGWQRGGSVAWQVFDATGKPAGEKGRAEGVPVWGLVSAAPRPDGSFVIFY